jgi:hypothetical protein
MSQVWWPSKKIYDDKGGTCDSKKALESRKRTDKEFITSLKKVKDHYKLK